MLLLLPALPVLEDAAAAGCAGVGLEAGEGWKQQQHAQRPDGMRLSRSARLRGSVRGCLHERVRCAAVCHSDLRHVSLSLCGRCRGVSAVLLARHGDCVRWLSADEGNSRSERKGSRTKTNDADQRGATLERRIQEQGKTIMNSRLCSI